jgi:hypothetical protein
MSGIAFEMSVGSKRVEINQRGSDRVGGDEWYVRIKERDRGNSYLEESEIRKILQVMESVRAASK